MSPDSSHFLKITQRTEVILYTRICVHIRVYVNNIRVYVYNSLLLQSSVSGYIYSVFVCVYVYRVCVCMDTQICVYTLVCVYTSGRYGSPWGTLTWCVCVCSQC